MGYKSLTKEFENSLRKITMMGYGLLMTCHLKEKNISQDDNKGIYSYKPDLNDRCLQSVNALVDIIGVIVKEWDENNECKRYLLTRATPTITAGSRFKYLDAKIPFGYKYLEEAVGRAIDKEAEINSAAVVDHIEKVIEKKKTFSEVQNEARELWNKLIEKDSENAKRIMKKVEIIFGRAIKLSEITEDQIDLYQLVVLEMQDMLAE